MAKIIVTGGWGKLGRACVKDLLAHGHDVINIDIAGPREQQSKFIRVDLTDYGQVYGVISGDVDEHPGVADAVIHLGAIPAPGMNPNATIFKNNVPTSYNVFEACRRAGVKNVVFASSETVLGLPFDNPPPYVPVDEEYFPRPETAYSLGKLLDETMAAQYCRWDSELKMAGLRFSNVMDPEDYAAFPGYNKSPDLRQWNLWGYIDARDGAQCIRKAMEANFKGFEAFIVANDDTVMSTPNKELMAATFPDVKFKHEVEPNQTLLSIDKAKKMLGFQPEFSWRNEV